MEEIPWVAVPFGSEAKEDIMDVCDPKGNHPTLSVLNGTTGEVIDVDGFSTIDLKGKDVFYNTYMARV